MSARIRKERNVSTSCRPRLRAGCITGEGRSHGGKSGVRGIAMTGKQEGVWKKKMKREGKKVKSKSKKELWKKKDYIARAGGKIGNPRQSSIKVKSKKIGPWNSLFLRKGAYFGKKKEKKKKSTWAQDCCQKKENISDQSINKTVTNRIRTFEIHHSR